MAHTNIHTDDLEIGSAQWADAVKISHGDCDGDYTNIIDDNNGDDAKNYNNSNDYNNDCNNDNKNDNKGGREDQ